MYLNPIRSSVTVASAGRAASRLLLSAAVRGSRCLNLGNIEFLEYRSTMVVPLDTSIRRRYTIHLAPFRLACPGCLRAAINSSNEKSQMLQPVRLSTATSLQLTHNWLKLTRTCPAPEGVHTIARSQWSRRG